MTPRRGERAAPPPGAGEWDIRFATNEAARGWEELSRRSPGPLRDCWLALRHRPTQPTNPTRQHRLHRSLGDRSLGGRLLPQWQYEVTGAARVWYCVDAEAGTVWVTHAAPGHP